MASCSDCKYFVSGSDYCNYYEIDWSDVKDDYDASNKFYSYLHGGASSCPHFTGKSDGCFLTSALVHYLGKKDDCEELTTLRAFRDGYMKSFEEGRKLVEEYYAVAPAIVKAIDGSDKRDEYYQDIYQTVTTCVSKIKAGKNKETMDLYCGMVNKYKALAF